MEEGITKFDPNDERHQKICKIIDEVLDFIDKNIPEDDPNRVQAWFEVLLGCTVEVAKQAVIKTPEAEQNFINMIVEYINFNFKKRGQENEK